MTDSQGHFAGLTDAEAKNLLSYHGPNEIKDVGHVSALSILLRQIKKNFILYLLAATVLVSFLVGKAITGYVILGVILVMISVGFIQEYRAEAAIEALRKMLMPVSVVIRGGKKKEVPASELVPGDIVVLGSGERVPADCTLLEGEGVRTDESLLTGESSEIEKKKEDTLFMGTFVVVGRSLAKVVETGMNTRFGKIAGMISAAEKQLPLADKVNKISKYMVAVALSAATFTALLMLSRADSISSDVIVEILILAIALSVAAFPEGFPVVLVTALATGASRMAAKNAIVNRMSIIETLGETTIICTDKTGTVTKGEMTVRKVYVDGRQLEVTGAGFEGNGEFLTEDKKPINTDADDTLRELFQASVLCSDARIERTGEDMKFRLTGTPTEGALMIMAAKADVYQENTAAKRLSEVPFSSERKMMSVLVSKKDNWYVYAKGAPEVILKKCKLTLAQRRKLLLVNRQMNGEAMRTLAIAYKKVSKNQSVSYTENAFEFLGLVGMEDPPRPEVAEAVAECARAGISVKLITGDHKDTAVAVARQVGITGKVLTGKQLDKLDEHSLAVALPQVGIFARVRPEHKLRVVKLLKKNGEIVTMTGDGVNDAPALKEAHIGVAMGIKGTDVSRSVADMTLKDDNFATIVEAVREGRTIFNNIRKFVSYQLSCNMAELLILLVGTAVAPLFGWHIPLLLALHILFMNLVTDNLPAITLAVNKASADIMDDPPRKKAEILSRPFIHLVLFNGSLMAVLTLVVYYISFNVLSNSTEYSRTMALVVLILLEIASAFNFRSYRKQVLTRSPLVNKYLAIASALSLLATLVIVYTGASSIFDTVKIGPTGWVLAVLAMFLVISIFDLLKVISNRTGKLLTHLK